MISFFFFKSNFKGKSNIREWNQEWRGGSKNANTPCTGCAMRTLLPYDCVESFLKDCPLLTLTHENARDVYGAVIEMLTAWSEDKHGDATPTETTWYACEHCAGGGELLINHKEAELVCKSCGVVRETSFMLMDNCRTFSERVDGTSTSGSTGHCASVPWWAQKAIASDAADTFRGEVERELHQWRDNPYAMQLHRSKDDLEKAKLDAMIPKRGSATTRAVAALLAPEISRFFEVNNIRECVERGVTLPRMEYIPIRPKYTCNRCGARVFEPYMQRKHPCGWAKRKKGALKSPRLIVR